MRDARPPPEPPGLVLALRGPISDADVRWLCERVRFLIETNAAELVVCDVGGVLDADAGTIEALARMQLTAKRLGRRVVVRDVRGEVRDLLGLAGLLDVLPCGELFLEAGREAEEREVPGRVEVERDPGDPGV